MIVCKQGISRATGELLPQTFTRLSIAIGSSSLLEHLSSKGILRSPASQSSEQQGILVVHLTRPSKSSVSVSHSLQVKDCSSWRKVVG